MISGKWTKMIYLGCSGWFYNPWIGRFYPEGINKGKWLEFYSQHFNTVEVNSTFYGFPKESMVKGWYKRAPQGFVFTLKANKQITRVNKLKNINKLLHSFYSLADLLEEKLGCILFQTPPSLYKDVALLKDFISQLDKKKNVIEFRHKS